MVDAEKYIADTAQLHKFAAEVARILADTAVPEFSSEPINVEDAAKLIGMKPAQVRAGIQYGWLPIGIATNNGKIIKGKSNLRLNFTIFPRKIWEVTGHIWKGKEALEKFIAPGGGGSPTRSNEPTNHSLVDTVIL